MHKRINGLIVLLVSLSALAACGGGGDPGLRRGALTVGVSGLPAGVDGALLVSGPGNYSRALTRTTTLDNLLPGGYTVTANGVVNGAASLAPTPSSQQVQVGSGATASASVAYAAGAPLALALQTVASGLAFPTFLTAPAGDTRLFIVERAGRVRVVDNGAPLPTPFLDMSGRTTTDGERGLLSLAFHPRYASNGLFFIYYTDVNGDIVIARLRVSAADRNVADPLSAVTLLTIPHPGFANHNGGLLSFGPDGLLYAGTGDGGGGGDPSGNAQNDATLLGKLLRIDVDRASPTLPYAIPADNPFAGLPGRRGEIWADGLRNPWRYAFDAAARLLYIADVGQDQWEEVDVAPLDQGGVNYGWNILEGAQCHNGAACGQAGLTPPVFQYQHGVGDVNGCSITGGYVYRGAAIPELGGRYLYSDYCGGWLKSFFYHNGAATEPTDWQLPPVGNIVSFGQDGQGELYLLSQTGDVHRIVRR